MTPTRNSEFVAPARPDVHVFALGGTIAMSGTPGNGVTPKLTADDLLAAVPGIEDVATIHAHQFRQVPSADLRLADLVALAAAISEAVAQGAHGAVVTVGTDGLAEVAFALDVLLEVEAPVVVLGAMRHPSQPGADGPANLLAGIRVAAARPPANARVFAVMNDEIHLPTFVRKTNTASVSTFSSPTVGPIGRVTETDASFLLDAAAPTPTMRVTTDRLPVVEVVPISLDDRGTLLRALRDDGDVAGVVIEALGGGHVPSWLANRIGDLAERLPVVLTSRVGSGSVLRETYGFVGSERDLLGRGVHNGGWLDAPKARILLTFACAAGIDPAEAFRHYQR